MTRPGISLPPVYYLQKWFWKSIDLIYPPNCAGCNTGGQRWCDHCQHNTKVIGQESCEICGLPGENSAKCKNCRQHLPSFKLARSWGLYTGALRQAVLRLKYRRDLGLAEVLAGSLANLLGTLNWDIDLVVPVPLSKGRLRERGYNQAAALARPLAWAWGLCYSDAALRKIRETSSQVSLSLDQRKANVVGAFSANPRIALNRNILVVDDVMTTGATLDACAAALKQAGAQYIYGLTLARTPDMPQA